MSISVIMPTYDQGHFISRAIKSLLLQSFNNWELIIINDGANDYTDDVVAEHLCDNRIKYLKNERNEGMGFTLNKGLQHTSYDLVAYLPSDDIYFEDHLQTLYNALVYDKNCVIAYAGMLQNYSNSSFSHGGQDTLLVADGGFQMVQVLHRKTNDLWVERETLVTDDLKVMYWNKLLSRGSGCTYPKDNLRMG